MMSTTGWLVFLLALPIIHPRWVASSNSSGFFGFEHFDESAAFPFSGMWRSLFRPRSFGNAIGGRLLDGKDREG